MNAKVLSAALAMVLFGAMTGCNMSTTAANPKGTTADAGRSYAERTLPLDRETEEWNKQIDGYDENQQFKQRDGDVITPDSLKRAGDDMGDAMKREGDKLMNDGKNAVDKFMNDAENAMDGVKN